MAIFSLCVLGILRKTLVVAAIKVVSSMPETTKKIRTSISEKPDTAA
jgi:hypothetical protein